MRNFAVKFAILTRRFEADACTQDFLDLCPEESLEVFKDALPMDALTALRFGFSDTALLNVLDYEFDVDLDRLSATEECERGALVFKKHTLDAESVRLAGLLDYYQTEDNDNAEPVFDEEDERLIGSLGEWLLDVTRPLYRTSLAEDRFIDIQAEYEECFRIYARKHMADDYKRLSELFGKIDTMTTFTHAMTVDAMFRADAAKLLFGEHSGYHMAWVRKQMFRHMISSCVRDYIAACAA